MIKNLSHNSDCNSLQIMVSRTQKQHHDHMNKTTLLRFAREQFDQKASDDVTKRAPQYSFVQLTASRL